MSPPDRTFTFRRRELSGSRLRCLMFTSGSAGQVASRLTRLIALPGVEVEASAPVMPRGFLCPAEARLGQAAVFLPEELREQLTDWWLEVRPGANTPNWDIVARATVESRPGLLLVEAKAHAGELKSAGKPLKRGQNERNHERIGESIRKANTGLEQVLPGWNLSRDSHYQLANRFAWSWRVASLGVPVVLVYLGFLNADEMRLPFRTAGGWGDAVRGHSSGRVPEAAWGRTLAVDGTPMIPVIRAVDVHFELSPA